MNIIDAVKYLKFKIEPKPENGGKSKNFYPNEKDFIAINLIMEFVEKSLLYTEKNKDVKFQKLYLFLFKNYLQKLECPVFAENKINEILKLYSINSLLSLIQDELLSISISNCTKQTFTKEKESFENIILFINNIECRDDVMLCNDLIENFCLKYRNFKNIRKQLTPENNFTSITPYKDIYNEKYLYELLEKKQSELSEIIFNKKELTKNQLENLNEVINNRIELEDIVNAIKLNVNNPLIE